MDNDTWSYYEALALVICLGYQCSQLRLWWKLIEVNFEDGLKQFSDDKHALELEEYAVNNNGEANLYVEHLSVNQPQYISYEELLQLAHAFLDEDEGERNGAHVDENDGAEVGHEDVQHVVQMLKLVLRWRGEEAPKGGTDGGVGPYENDVVDDGVKMLSMKVGMLFVIMKMVQIMSCQLGNLKMRMIHSLQVPQKPVMKILMMILNLWMTWAVLTILELVWLILHLIYLTWMMLEMM